MCTANQATAAALKVGAMTASTNKSAAARAATKASSTGRLAAMTPPKADTGSEASAAGKAAAMLSPTARPQGERCLTMTTAGAVNDSAARPGVVEQLAPRRAHSQGDVVIGAGAGAVEAEDAIQIGAVSYTHLTLPTSDLV